MTQSITMHKFEYNQDTAHEDFPDWKFLFENYLELAGINKNDDVGTPKGKVVGFQNLVHAGDALAIKMLKAHDDPSKATYVTLMEKLEAYCAPKNTETASKYHKAENASSNSGNDDRIASHRNTT